MTNIVITTATIILTIIVPAGVMVTVEQSQQTVAGKPVEQINVSITGTPNPSTSPVPSVSPSPSPTVNPSPTPTVTAPPSPSPRPSPPSIRIENQYQNLPQPSINDFSNVPQPQNMLTNAENVENSASPNPAPVLRE